MPHATLTRFGYPSTLVHEGKGWCVLLRPAQVTLGSLVLVCKEEATAFSAISPGAFAELGGMIKGIETALQSFNPYDRINYLMLMMVDPHVHFHVIPRYAAPQHFEGLAFPDQGWPGQPLLQHAVSPEQAVAQSLKSAIAACWPRETA
jgi:diadenosine tetraphosphate (Ap4A) HIT family hydrolase